MDVGAVIVFSDTHFGFEPESKTRFKNLLDWLTTSERKVVTAKGEARTLEVPSKVILLGDILEYWTPRDADPSLALRDGFENLRSLFAFTPEIVYVAGNHDHVIGSYADEYGLKPGSRLLVRPDHYPDALSDKPGKKYKGEQIGDKLYFFVHGHQFDVFRFPAVLNFGDIMAQNSAMSRNFKWLTRFGLLVLVISALVAQFPKGLRRVFKSLGNLLQSASLPSLLVMVVLLLWGFFVFLGVLWVFGALAFAYYEYTSHLGVIRRRSKREPRIDIKKLLDHRFYKPEKDTIEADVLVFGHTHMPEIRAVDVGGRTKLFVNSGSWIQYPGDRYDTFVYIDRGGVLLLRWDGENVRELSPTEGVVAAKWPLNRRNPGSSI